MTNNNKKQKELKKLVMLWIVKMYTAKNAQYNLQQVC